MGYLYITVSVKGSVIEFLIKNGVKDGYSSFISRKQGLVSWVEYKNNKKNGNTKVLYPYGDAKLEGVYKK